MLKDDVDLSTSAVFRKDYWSNISGIVGNVSGSFDDDSVTCAISTSVLVNSKKEDAPHRQVWLTYSTIEPEHWTVWNFKARSSNVRPPGHIKWPIAPIAFWQVCPPAQTTVMDRLACNSQVVMRPPMSTTGISQISDVYDLRHVSFVTSPLCQWVNVKMLHISMIPIGSV